jgi:hypothetical protein
VLLSTRLRGRCAGHFIRSSHRTQTLVHNTLTYLHEPPNTGSRFARPRRSCRLVSTRLPWANRASSVCVCFTSPTHITTHAHAHRHTYHPDRHFTHTSDAQARHVAYNTVLWELDFDGQERRCVLCSSFATQSEGDSTTRAHFASRHYARRHCTKL